MNTARQMLWLPTTREEKYKAKQAIDTFFVRGGDVLSAAVVFAGTHMLNLTVEQFALANLALTLVWLALAAMIARPETAAPGAPALGGGGGGLRARHRAVAGLRPDRRRCGSRPGDAAGGAGSAPGREGDAAAAVHAGPARAASERARSA